MATSYLVSTLLMGALVALIAAVAVRNRRWYRYAPQTTPDATGALPADERPSLLDRPGVWIAGFVALVLFALGGVFAFVTAPDAPSALLGGPVVVVAALLLAGYVLLGVYTAAKGRGHPSSIAAAETATVFGALFLVAVAVQLIG